jgi:hypothetical protein
MVHGDSVWGNSCFSLCCSRCLRHSPAESKHEQHPELFFLLTTRVLLHILEQSLIGQGQELTLPGQSEEQAC